MLSSSYKYTLLMHTHYLKLLTQQWLLVLSLSKLTKNFFLFPHNCYVEINTCYWIAWQFFITFFRLNLKKTLNSISYCNDINVLPLVWITWANSHMNINTIEPLVIEKLMQVLTVIVQNTASGNNIAGIFNI